MTIRELIRELESLIEEDEKYPTTDTNLTLDSEIRVFDGDDYEPFPNDLEVIGGNFFPRCVVFK